MLAWLLKLCTALSGNPQYDPPYVATGLAALLYSWFRGRLGMTVESLLKRLALVAALSRRYFMTAASRLGWTVNCTPSFLPHCLTGIRWPIGRACMAEWSCLRMAAVEPMSTHLCIPGRSPSNRWNSVSSLVVARTTS